jgi:long-subunit acyl-CoA synthetase (AMP-forming)
MSAAILFDALAARPHDAVVLRGESEVWRTAELLEEIDTVAAKLADCRVLALLADNSPDWAITDLAALRSATVLLPLPAFFTAAQLTHALDQSGADTVVTDQPERIAALGIGFALYETRRGLHWMKREIDPVPLPAGTAKISYTSGSTGTPKGVCLSAAGLIDTAQAVRSRLSDLTIERHLAVLPLGLLLENSAGIYAPMLRGAEIHLPPLASLGWQGMSGFAPDALQKAVAAERPHSLILVPELLKAWLLFLAKTGLQAPAGLTYVAVGGSRVEHATLIQARRLGIPAYQGYGLTECGSVVSLNRPGDDGDDAGRPLSHVRVAIRDNEIHVSTRAFLGYLGDPAPVAGTSFPTGDLGRLGEDGHLHLSGRSKNLLITSFGRNISPEWVESNLLAQPEIVQAIVAGDARSVLSAIVVPFPGANHDAIAAAITRANAALPDYARIGHWITAAPFTVSNAQATGNGRPIRSAILNHYAAQIAALYQHEETPHVVL